MDMKPKIIKKFKPKVPTKACETCEYKRGDFFQDIEDKEITRVYCKARYTNVIADEMTKYCDFHKPKVNVDDKRSK